MNSDLAWPHSVKIRQCSMELAGGVRETGTALSMAFGDRRGTQYRRQEHCERSRWRRLGRIGEGEELWVPVSGCWSASLLVSASPSSYGRIPKWISYRESLGSSQRLSEMSGFGGFSACSHASRPANALRRGLR